MARATATVEIDELPEADRLEGFPHPRQTKKLFGHEAAERLTRTYVRQRLQVRFKRTPQLPVSFGCQVNGELIKGFGFAGCARKNFLHVPFCLC